MNTNSNFAARLCAIGIFGMLAVPGAPVCAQQDAGFQWSITPYLWASDTKVDLSFRDANIGNGNLSFGDLLDVLDAAFMLHAEGGRGGWSAFADWTYLETSDTNPRQVLTIDSESKQTFLDLAAAWWPRATGDKFNIYGGIRYSSFSDKYRFRLGDQVLGQQNSNADYTDFLVGLRYRFDLSERWSLLTQADTSFGDSEGTWLGRADFGYKVGKRAQNRILFGYQYKQAKFKDGDLVTDYSYQGPMLGFNFRF